MRRFELLEPRSIEETCALLNRQPDAKVIAGGTTLLVLIKHGLYVPGTLINLKKINEASTIRYDPREGLRIGALATIREVELASAVRQHYPLLAEACHAVANIRIRNLATIGGNLARADYQSDPPVALLALEANVELTGIHGVRRISLEKFLLGTYETALEPGELLSAVLLPLPPSGILSNYLKFTTRSSEDRPCVGVAALVRAFDGRCEELRLAIGAVSPVPVRVRQAEDLARGQRLTPELVEAIGSAAAESVEPVEDLSGSADYKRHLVRVLTARAVASCTTKGVVQ